MCSYAYKAYMHIYTSYSVHKRDDNNIKNVQKVKWMKKNVKPFVTYTHFLFLDVEVKLIAMLNFRSFLGMSDMLCKY